MAIDQYQPELSKRVTAFKIAHRQLEIVMRETDGALSYTWNRSKNQEVMEGIEEAVKDFLETTRFVADWRDTKLVDDENIEAS